jgi:hypothetical protein
MPLLFFVMQVVSPQKRSGYSNTKRVNGRAVLGTTLSFARKQELADESVDSFLNWGDIVGGGSAVEVRGLISVLVSVSEGGKWNKTEAVEKENEQKDFGQSESLDEMAQQKGTVHSRGDAGLSAMEQVNGVGLVSDGRVFAGWVSDGRVSDERTECKSGTEGRASVKERVSREVSAYQPEARTTDARTVDARTVDARTEESIEEESLAKMTVREDEAGKVQRKEERAKQGRGKQEWGEGALRETFGADQTQNERSRSDDGAANVTSAEARPREGATPSRTVIAWAEEALRDKEARAEPAQETKDWTKGKEAGVEPALMKLAWAEGGLGNKDRADDGIADATLVESQQGEGVSSTREKRVWAESGPNYKTGTEGPKRKDAWVGGGMDDGLLVETNQKRNKQGIPIREIRDWSEGTNIEKSGAEERRTEGPCEDGSLKEGRSAEESCRHEAPAEPAGTEAECSLDEKVQSEGSRKGEAWADGFVGGGQVAENEGQAGAARKEEAGAERASADGNSMQGSGRRDYLVEGLGNNETSLTREGQDWEDRIPAVEALRAEDRTEGANKKETQTERTVKEAISAERALETENTEEGAPRDEVPGEEFGTKKTRMDGSRAEEAPAEQSPNLKARRVLEDSAGAESAVGEAAQAGKNRQEGERAAGSETRRGWATDARRGSREAESATVGPERGWTEAARAEDAQAEDTPRGTAWTEADRAGGSLKANRMKGAQAEATPAAGAREEETGAEGAPLEKNRAEDARQGKVWADEVRVEKEEEEAEAEALPTNSSKVVLLETETAPGLGFQEAEPKAAEPDSEHRNFSPLLVTLDHTLPYGPTLVTPATEFVGGEPAERKTEQMPRPSVMEVRGEKRTSSSADEMKAGGRSRTASNSVERRSSRGSTDYRMGDGLEMLLQGLVADEDEVSSEGSSDTDEERGECLSGASYRSFESHHIC